MKVCIEEPYGPYAGMYEKFFELKDRYYGYDFGSAPNVKNPPPHVLFPEPLRWWSLDRGRRLRAIRQVRDQYLMDIINMGRISPSDIGVDVCDKTRRRAGNRTKGSQGTRPLPAYGLGWQRQRGDRRAA